MVPRRHLPLKPQRGRLFSIQFPKGHPHDFPARRGGSGCPNNSSTQAEALLPTPSSTVARAWPAWSSGASRGSPLTVPARWDSWKRSQCAHGEKALCTGHVVRLATFLARPGNASGIPPTRTQAVASPALCAPTYHDGVKREHRNFLGKSCVQDHTRRWNKSEEKNSRWPDFRHKEFLDPSWFDNRYNFTRVDAQLATPDARANRDAPVTSPWCLSLEQAGQLIGPGFEKPPTPESVRQLCQQGQIQGAFEILEILVGMSSSVDKYLLHSVLKECVLKKDLMLGGQVHALAVRMGLGSDTFLCNHFIRMYAGHGKLQDAIDVFRGVAQPDSFMWSSIISAHVKQGHAKQAVDLYQRMRATRMKPNSHVLVAAGQACAAAGDLNSGKQLHDDVLNNRMEHDMFVCNCLVDMYAKCGSLKDARRVFDGLREKDVVTWNAMITGYARVDGMGQEALGLYSAMHNEGMVAPNAVTFVGLLQACASVGLPALEMGRQLHSKLKDRRLESDLVVGGSLVNMYVKCGSLKDARIVFDGLNEKNVVTWNAMISGYAQQEGMGEEALKLYTLMHNEVIAVPDAVTFACLLRACANIGVSALQTGMQLHSHIKDRQLESDVVVGGSLVNMYVKCGSLKDARVVFDRLSEKNVVTWTAMIAGYAQAEGMSQEALFIYSVMCNEGIATPDAVTYVWLLEACASVGALQQGKQLHSEIRERGFEFNELIGTCLVKMYAKCGCLESLRDIFDRLPRKKLMTWNALLKGYAEHGEGGMAIQCFEELLEQGIQPDEVTYTCLFTACSHAGLVNQGEQYFNTMVERHGIEPNDRLYCCIVDLLGRSGHLDRAEGMLRASGLAGDVVSWRALLSSCKSYGDAETARRCFDHLVKLEPTVATPYVLLSNIYANTGRWAEVGRVESMRKVAGARKVPGKACIEVKKEVHEFTVGEERSDVAATLRKMNTRVRNGGHVPQTQLVLRSMSEPDKEDALCGHAEKLALAYGLLNTPVGSTLVVTKNLRMCNDCHSSTKIMSKLEKRGIVVRDSHKVHRFRNGACSCQDRP